MTPAPRFKRICVFCGSSPGSSPEYVRSAQELGALLAREKIGLVYGGASVGLMGALADAAIGGGGKAIGVFPRFLMSREIAHPGLTELRVVDSMHERKRTMEMLSDGFIALPGGFGTFEEFCEILTWAQLGLHRKPCAILNLRGYYDGFIRFVDHAIEQGFIRDEHRPLLLVDHDPRALLKKMAAYSPPNLEKWLKREDEA